MNRWVLRSARITARFLLLRRNKDVGVRTHSLTQQMDSTAFDAAAAALHADALAADGWKLTRDTDALGKEHAMLECVLDMVPATASVATTSPDTEEPFGSSDGDDDADVAKAPPAPTARRSSLCLRMVFDWSPSFRMPVCHFSAATASGTPVSDGDSLKRAMPWLNVDSDSTTSGALVTPTVHELTGRVMFLVHPCDVHTLNAAFVEGTSPDPAARSIATLRFVIGFAFSTLRLPVPFRK